jgi:hypothetical protein
LLDRVIVWFLASAHLLNARVWKHALLAGDLTYQISLNYSCATVPDYTPVSPLSPPIRGSGTKKALFICYFIVYNLKAAVKLFFLGFSFPLSRK